MSKSSLSLSHLFGATRPKTLTAAIVPCLVGTSLAWVEGGAPVWSLFFWGVLSATLIQVGTNLVNDAMDFKKGADTHERIGPERVTQQGHLSFSKVMALGTLFFLLAILCGIPLVLKGGWMFVGVGLLSVLMGYAYTAGPFPLAYLGLGDVFVMIFFGLIAVVGMSYLQTYVLSVNAVIAGLQIGSLATVLIAINNLRDVEQDCRANKRTLAVRFGLKFVRLEIMFLILVPFLLNLYWYTKGQIMTSILPFVVFPLGVGIVRSVWGQTPNPIYNKFLARSALLHLSFGLALSFGYFLDAI